MPTYKPDRAVFEAEVIRRGITRVVHFTPAINLISIYGQKALLSREQLKRLTVEYPDLHLADYVEINDQLRLDHLNDYLNLSIQHPNHLLFKKFRESCRNLKGIAGALLPSRRNVFGTQRQCFPSEMLQVHTPNATASMDCMKLSVPCSKTRLLQATCIISAS